MRLTDPTPSSAAFVEQVRPAMERVTGHELFRRLGDASATLAQCRRALLGFYPLVEAFPRYMTVTLERFAGDERPRADEARAWLRANIKTESRHARWWRDWGRSFGIADSGFHRPTSQARSEVETKSSAGRMEAPTRYLLEVATERSIAESVAAVNYAVEGSTGVWTRATLPAFVRLGQQLGLALDERALRWVSAHADYDDRHPHEALEIVKTFADEERSRDAAARAAIQSLHYLGGALDEALAA